MNRLKEEFNKQFTRKSLGKDKGKYRDDWFVKEGVTPKEIWNWINQNYISKEEILGLKILNKRSTGYNKNVINAVINEIKEQIIDYKNKETR